MKKIEEFFLDYEYLDCIILSSKANKFYMGGKYSQRGYVVLIKGSEKPYFFIDYRSINYYKGKDNKIIIGKDDDPKDIVFRFLKKQKIKNIGLEGNALSYNEYMEIIKNNKEYFYYSIDFDSQRIIKTNQEIDNIRQACRISDESYLNMLKQIKIGLTEREIENILYGEMMKRGADGIAFETIVLSGSRTAYPHGKTSNKKIEYGDTITVDFGAKFNNYCSDMTRTFFVGEPKNKEIKTIYNIVKKANEETLNYIEIDQKMEDVDSFARKIIESNGYGEYFTHHLGHSIGIDSHENPRFSNGTKNHIKENMVMTVEPGIYVEGIGGVRIEDTVLMTKEGAVSLNASTKELIILEV